MGFFRRKRRQAPKACVFGVDGVPHSLLVRFMDEGVMPRAAGIFRSGGSLHKMRVTLPEISSVSWTSFMTGVGPGIHGVYGFTDFRPASYNIGFPSFPDLMVPTTWDRLGNQGKRSVVINQPSTYPARRIPGALISGFVAIEKSKAVWPPALLSSLDETGYEIDIDSGRGGKDADFLFAELESTLEGREKLWERLWRDEEWDLFEVVVTGTDRLMHFQMQAATDSSDPNHGRFLEYYNKVDSFLGKVYDRYVSEVCGGDNDRGFFALSDHGFTEIRQEFYMNAWLRAEGYLSFRTEEPESFNDIDPAAKALALDPTRIYIHSKDRFPRGTVTPEEAQNLCEEISAKLMGVEYEGEKVFQAVHRGIDLYEGPRARKAPDLVAVANDGYDVKGWLRGGDPFGRSHFTGMHTWDDAFLWTSETMPEEFDITGIAGVIEKRVLSGE